MRARQIILFIFFFACVLPIYCTFPGAREGAVGWSTGDKLWLFGGVGFAENSTKEGFLNDLWYFDPSSSTWTFIVGDQITNGEGVFGAVGAFSPTFHPEGLQEMCAWQDSNDALYIFGGEANGGFKANDVWEFNTTINQWRWLNGTDFNSKGRYNPRQFIGSRSLSQCLVINNTPYVFAGIGYNSYGNGGLLQDLWTFDKVTYTWNWRGGIDISDCTGTLVQNVPSSNTSFLPPCQAPASAWLDGDALMFAAGTLTSGLTNNMYRYKPSTEEWTWLSETVLSKRDSVGSVSDDQGNAWMFGGYGEPYTAGNNGLLSDFSFWDGASWLYLAGPTKADAQSLYPITLGTGDNNTYPGGRRSPVMWRDNKGDLWLFGGFGYGENSTAGYLNDLWKYSLSDKTWMWISGSKQINQRGFYQNSPLGSAPSIVPVVPPNSDNSSTPSAASSTPVNAPVFPSQTDQVLLGVLIPVGVIGAGLVVLLVMLRRRKKRKQKLYENGGSAKPERKDEDVEMMPESTTVYNPTNGGPVTGGTYSSITGDKPDNSVVVKDSTSGLESSRLIPYSAVTLGREIGVGSYGKVYLGKLRTTNVAVKVANTNIPQEEFIREANFQLAIPPHPNIVQLLGISIDGPQPLVVLEYCNEGSLDKLLFESDKLNTPSEQIALAEAIARGLDHLHQNNIVHRDLAVRNVLLNRGEPKISDFGMSRKLKEASQVGKTATNIGPIRWMAPEALGKQLYSTKSDVWTFGILLYEIVARQEPHANDDLLTVGVKIRDEGYAPEIPENCPELLQTIMKMCWRLDPEKRPEMSEICKLLDEKK